MTASTVFESHLQGLRKIHQGKVRDLYEVDARHLLIVATDRLSAFDVILPDPIPGKGRILTQISNFWFAKTADLVRNHLVDWPIEGLTTDPAERAMLAGRSVVVKRLKALPLEAVVRGYLIGSGWKDYQRTGEVCGIRLPAGLRMADRLPQPIFTPATKAGVGQHDENIGFGRIVELVGPEIAAQVRDLSLRVYRYAADYALQRGIIIADTKFEFGLDEANNVVLMDEVLTPDSSRFWPVATYAPGASPPSFDKQFVRDYLETLAWNKQAPGPRIPAEIIAKTAAKYAEALQRICEGSDPC